MLMMTSKKSKHACGFTFTEIMGAILVLTVAVLGASAYRYHATLDVRKADLQTTGARVTCLLCETWRGSSDPNTFDPINHFSSELTVESVMLSEAPAAPTGHVVLGTYRITVEGVDYRALLYWKDVSAGLRALSVIVVWEWESLTLASLDSYIPSKSFRLTTYVTI
jgi:hypothetical protein